MPLATLIPETLSTPSDLASFESLHALHQPRIFRFLLASLRDRDLALTLTQDTFLRAWSARDSFRGDCAPSTWLTRIALNLLRDHTRTNRFRFWKHVSATAIRASDLAAHLPHPNSSAESRLIATEEVARLWQTVATLSDRQRTVFLLRFLDDLDLAEISLATGLPLPTVKTHLYRALTTVRARQLHPHKDPK